MSAYTLAVVGIVAFGVVVAFVYVRRHVAEASAALDKPTIVADADGLLARWNAKLLGWKTAILAWLAAVAQVLAQPDVVTALTGARWETVLDQKTANLVSLACTVLIPLTHAVGLSKAAKAAPADQG